MQRDEKESIRRAWVVIGVVKQVKVRERASKHPGPSIVLRAEVIGQDTFSLLIL